MVLVFALPFDLAWPIAGMKSHSKPIQHENIASASLSSCMQNNAHQSHGVVCRPQFVKAGQLANFATLMRAFMTAVDSTAHALKQLGANQADNRPLWINLGTSLQKATQLCRRFGDAARHATFAQGPCARG